MPTADDYVTPEARYHEQAHEMSGAPPDAGMAPYPLYGLPSLGEETEGTVPFYKRPLFCYAIGGAAGFGLGFVVFGWFKPKFMKKNLGKKRRTTRKKPAGVED